MLKTEVQSPETKIDQICKGLGAEAKTCVDNLTRLSNLLNRLEEQPPVSHAAVREMEVDIKEYGPGHIYQLHALLEEAASNNRRFDNLLNRLSQYI